VRTRSLAGMSGTVFSIFLPERIEPGGPSTAAGDENQERQEFPVTR